jgi:hypothetical protein
VAAEL